MVRTPPAQVAPCRRHHEHGHSDAFFVPTYRGQAAGSRKLFRSLLPGGKMSRLGERGGRDERGKRRVFGPPPH